jgi:hypothetical protein
VIVTAVAPEVAVAAGGGTVAVGGGYPDAVGGGVVGSGVASGGVGDRLVAVAVAVAIAVAEGTGLAVRVAGGSVGVAGVAVCARSWGAGAAHMAARSTATASWTSLGFICDLESLSFR